MPNRARAWIDGFRRSGHAVVLLLLVSSSPVLATNHFTRIEQLMVGASGDTDVQFLEMKFEDSSQNLWAVAAMLTFHDAAGTLFHLDFGGHGGSETRFSRPFQPRTGV